MCQVSNAFLLFPWGIVKFISKLGMYIPVVLSSSKMGSYREKVNNNMRTQTALIVPQMHRCVYACMLTLDQFVLE